MGHFRMVLKTLKEHQLYAKYSKCVLLLRLFSLLAHIISSVGVKVDPRKMEAVKIGLDHLLLLTLRVSWVYSVTIGGFLMVSHPLHLL